MSTAPPARIRNPLLARPEGMGLFEFVAVSSLRAAQLMRGCSPRVARSHTTARTAQIEVSEGKVTPLVSAEPTALPSA